MIHDKGFHLLDGQVQGDYFRDAEERGLQDSIGTITQANFLCYLGCVDVVHFDIVLGEVTLQLVRNELHQFFPVKMVLSRKVPFLRRPRVTSYIFM